MKIKKANDNQWIVTLGSGSTCLLSRGAFNRKMYSLQPYPMDADGWGLPRKANEAIYEAISAELCYLAAVVGRGSQTWHYWPSLKAVREWLRKAEAWATTQDSEGFSYGEGERCGKVQRFGGSYTCRADALPAQPVEFVGCAG